MKLDNEIIRKIDDEIKEKTVELIEECRKYNILSIMEGLVNNHESIYYNEHLSEVNLEYLLSVLTGIEKYENMEININSVKIISNNVSEIIQKYIYYFMATSGLDNEKNPVEAMMKFKTILNNMIIRGNSYEVHHNDLFIEFFEEHDAKLKEILNYSSNEILDYAKQVQYLFGERIRDNLEKVIQNEMFKKILETVTNKKVVIPDFINHEEIMESYKSNQVLKEKISSEIFNLKGIMPNELLEKFSLEIGDNKEFINQKYMASPINQTLILRKPFIKINGNYYCFKPNLFSRNIFKIIETEIKEKSLKYYEKNFTAKKGKKLEILMLRYFGKLLPNAEKYGALYYYPENKQESRCEADGMIICNDTLLLLEAKAGYISNSAKNGSILRIKRDLGELIDEAFKQGIRTKKHIEKEESPKFYNERNELVLELKNKDKFKKIYIINVTLEYLGAFTNELEQLKKIGLLKENEWIWSIFIDDLRIFSEINEFPSEFLHYIDKRFEINSHSKYKTSDEVDLYLYYLNSGIFTLDNTVRESDAVFLANFTEECLDKYYNSKDENLKPKLNIPEVLKKIFINLEQSIETDNFVRFVLEVNRNELDEKYKIALENCYNDLKVGKEHDFTTYYKDTNTGITFAFSLKENLAKFVEYVKIKMYETKAENWFLLCIDLDNKMILRHIKKKWETNKELEYKMEIFRQNRAYRTNNVKSVGRNEKCPCGSGVKYKKCCGKYK